MAARPGENHVFVLHIRIPVIGVHVVFTSTKTGQMVQGHFSDKSLFLCERSDEIENHRRMILKMTV